MFVYYNFQVMFDGFSIYEEKKHYLFLALYKKVMFHHLFGELIFNIAQKFGFS